MNKKGLYKHFKGKTYRVLYFAKDSETLENVVVYQNNTDASDIWVRPQKMFFSKVIVDGTEVDRFQFIRE